MQVDPSRYATDAELAWLAEQMARDRVPQAEMARLVRVEPSALSRAMRGERKLRRVHFDAMVRKLEGFVNPYGPSWRLEAWKRRLMTDELSATSGIDASRMAELLSGRGEPATDVETAGLDAALAVVGEGITRYRPPGQIRDRPAGSLRNAGDVNAGAVPILAAAFVREDGYAGMTDEVAEMRRPVPARLEGVRGCYGLFVGNEMFVPRWYPGEVLYMHPGKPLVAGRWFICGLASGGHVIGLAKEVTDTAVDVVALVPRGRFSLERRDMVSLAVIVGTWSE